MRPSRFLLVSIVCLLFVVAAPSMFGQTVTTLHSFTGGNSAYPFFVVPAQGRDGNIYGTAGGLSAYFGSIFRVSTEGQWLQMLAFDGADGIEPAAGLTLGTDGNLYGTTSSGGASGLGVLFRITPQGQYSDLYDFPGGVGGELPYSLPIQAIDGNLYGTALGGDSSCNYGCGVVYRFEIKSSTFTQLYQFDITHGEYPYAPLMQASDRHLYGTTYQGGANGCGTIFEMSTSGVLLWSYSFPAYGTGGGCNPYSPLIQGTDGSFYGTTYSGGTIDWGTVFKLDAGRNITILHKFAGDASDVRTPIGGLVQGTDGNLYGTGQIGCTGGWGGLFQATTSGGYKLLYCFPSKGGEPDGGLLQHTNGQFYGVANGGGRYDYGSVYSLNMGLGPFVTFVRSTSKVGQTAQILGQGLTGTTSVTFNGIAATSFTVVNDTYMTAVVPSGATTGKVVVTTPGGALTSNVNFRIIQ